MKRNRQLDRFSMEYVVLLVTICEIRQITPSFHLFLSFLHCLSFPCALNASASRRRKHGILCRGSRRLERRRKSVSVMRFGGLAARLERRRSGAESLLCVSV